VTEKRRAQSKQKDPSSWIARLYSSQRILIALLMMMMMMELSVPLVDALVAAVPGY